jgi:hypothetical protein
MKKSIFAFIAVLVLTFAFSTVCFAKGSPTGNVITTTKDSNQGGNVRDNRNGGETDGNGGNGVDINNNNNNNKNNSGTSPKTGAQVAVPLIAIITLSGAIVIARKELSQEK